MEATYQVKLTFSSNLTERQKDDIVETLLNTLIHQANTGGIVPDDAEGWTETISVSREDSGAFLGRNLMTGELI